MASKAWSIALICILAMFPSLGEVTATAGVAGTVSLDGAGAGLSGMADLMRLAATSDADTLPSSSMVSMPSMMSKLVIQNILLA